MPLLVMCPLAIGLACMQSELKEKRRTTTGSYTCTFASGLSPSVIQIETYSTSLGRQHIEGWKMEH